MNRLRPFIFIMLLAMFACGEDDVPEAQKWPYKVTFINNGGTDISYARVKAAMGYVDIADNFTLAVSLSKNVFDDDDEEYFLRPNDTIVHVFDSLVYAGCKVSVKYSMRRLIDFESREQGPLTSYILDEKVLNGMSDAETVVIWPRDSALFTFIE